jgi:3-oxoadipate enol-lactonase
MSYEFADVNGTRLHYQMEGAGRPLVLIHAGIANLNMWNDQVNAFADQYRVIRYDLRGWGESVEVPDEYRHHDDLQALLAYLGIGKATIVAVSFGGLVALNFVLTYPEMVEALVLVGAAVGGYEVADEALIAKEKALDEAYERGDKPLAAEIAAQMWVDGPNRTPDQVDPAVRTAALEMILHTFDLPEDGGERLKLDPPAISRLGEIEVPTLVLVGQHDAPDIFAMADKLVADIPGAKRIVMPGTAHLPNMEKPAEFNRNVLAFLRQLGLM